MGPAGQRRGTPASGHAALTRGPGLSASAGESGAGVGQVRWATGIGGGGPSGERAGRVDAASGREEAGPGSLGLAEKKGKGARARLKEGLG